MDPSKYEKLKFYSNNDLHHIRDDIEHALTVPVNLELEGKHKILDLREIQEVLSEAKKIIVQNCGCKTDYDNCETPREVCLTLDYDGDISHKDNKYNPREIETDEALEILEESHKAGLVHMSYLLEGNERPSPICSCCPCCCHTLGSLVRNKKHAPIIESRYIADHRDDKCTNCGICVERCVFQARKMRDNCLVYDKEQCFGCGLCITICPEQANVLVLR